MTKKINIIGFLALITAPLSGLGIDIFVPSLPAIAQYFSVDPSKVQLSVGIYLIGYASMQIFWGALSDSVGRRSLILFGISGVMLASVLIAFAPNVPLFLALRFLQGVCVAPCLVIARALLTDTMTGRKLEIYSYSLPMAWGMSPIIAPWIGGYLQHYFGWRSPFLFLAAYCLILLLLMLKYLPETLAQRKIFSLKATKNATREIINHPIFLTAAVVQAIVYSLLTIFNVVGPFLVQTALGYSAIVYGHIALCMGLAWFFGTLLIRSLSNYFATKKIIKVTFILLVIVSILFLFLSLFYFNLWIITLPLFALFCGTAIIYASFLALCLSLFKQFAGTASAVMGTIIMTGAGLLSAFASLLQTKTSLPLAISYFVLISLALVLFMKFIKTND